MKDDEKKDEAWEAYKAKTLASFEKAMEAAHKKAQTRDEAFAIVEPDKLKDKGDVLIFMAPLKDGMTGLEDSIGGSLISKNKELSLRGLHITVKRLQAKYGKLIAEDKLGSNFPGGPQEAVMAIVVAKFLETAETAIASAVGMTAAFQGVIGIKNDKDGPANAIKQLFPDLSMGMQEAKDKGDLALNGEELVQKFFGDLLEEHEKETGQKDNND